jgi:cytochrome c-type biogenesis protein
MVEPTLPIAFAAGLVSFLSPCVLPLVPGYLSFMSGYGPEQRRSLETAAVAAAFVFGFTLVFVALGASATLLGSVLRSNRELLMRLSGALIIVLGLVFLGVIRIPWLYRERRFHPTPKAGLYGSVVLGAAFAFGWSPCIGVTMGAALTLAASRNTMAEGALLLAVYSLGLGVPFILAGLGVAHLAGALSWLRSHTRALNLAGGALLVIVGLLFVTDRVTELSAWMQRGMTEANLDFWSF